MPSDLISRDRLRALLEGARGKRVAVIGDAMLDVYLRGDVERISPEAPVPVVRVRERRLALGGAANVAQNVAALAATPDLVAAIGNDSAGADVVAALEKLGAPTSGLVRTSRPTTTKTRVVARGQQVLRFDEEVDHAFAAADAAALGDAVRAAVARADAVVLEDYNKGVLGESLIGAAIAAAKARGAPVVVDPKYHNFFAYRGASLFKPNRRELDAALGAAVNVEQPDALHEAVERLDVGALLLTLSEKGMALVTRGSKQIHRIPTTAREVFDVVGAGDTVTAYLALMLAAGATLLEAAVVANFAAGVEVGKSGAATVTADEVLAAFDAHRAAGAAGTPATR
ncbi:MAG: D-glycero-beta-D-manno-heptose-7-phosphate kinase [Gemmatimonadetes bacterium]|nr:D-glycero-beta-D-manno-heptose-7-phosphate kinase [Gemmatimonadota bacterium]